jgi:HAD superfamily hydrolase (TIGR01509 family)
MSIKIVPKNLLFDLGGVLLNIDYCLTSKAFQKLGWQNFDDFYSQKNQQVLFDQLEIGAISPKEFIESIQKINPNFSDLDIIEAWNAMLLDLPKERIELLKQLKKNHLLLLLSNTNVIHFEAFNSIIKTQHTGLHIDELFHATYYSHQLGKRKPNIETFQYIIKMHKINASETLFIDDSIQHIEGAKKAGLETYHLQKGEDITQLFLDTTPPKPH